MWLGWPESPAADLASPGDDPLMLTQHESPAPAPAAVSGTSQKLLQLLRKRLRQLARVTLVLAICLAVAAAALAIWWLDESERAPGHRRPVRCRGVPRLPRSRRSECLHISPASERKAHSHSGAGRGQGADPDDPKFSWSIANPKLREWAGENREALELFLQGADQPDAAHPAGEPTANVDAWQLELAGISRGEQATRERRHGGRLGLLSRGPPHDHPHQAAGKHASASFRQEGEPLVCSDGSPTGRRIRGPRSPNFIPPWKKCSRTSQTPIGISLQLNMGISNSCARSSGRCRFLFSRRSRGNGRFGSATWHFRRP